MVLQCNNLAWYLLQHFHADFAFGNFAQSSNASFVLRLNFGRVALIEHAGAIGRGQNELKAIGDFLQAIFYSDACHQVLRVRSVGFRDIERLEGVGAYTPLGRIFEALGVNNRLQIKESGLKQFVDYNEVEFCDLSHLLLGISQA